MDQGKQSQENWSRIGVDGRTALLSLIMNREHLLAKKFSGNIELLAETKFWCLPDDLRNFLMLCVTEDGFSLDRGAHKSVLAGALVQKTSQP